MIEPTLVTWGLTLFGLVVLFPLIVYVQLLVAKDPKGIKTQNVWLGKGERWRDKSQLDYAYGTGWADLIFWMPLGVAGSIGVLLGRPWGYGMWLASGAIAIYINIIYWFAEGAFFRERRGLFAYYTYEWGIWMYWGIAVVVYASLRLIC